MALAEPWADADPKTKPMSQTYDDVDVMTVLSSTETQPHTVVLPKTSGMDLDVWGVWWPLHRYGFGTLFLLLCIYALYATVLRVVHNRAVGGGGVRSRKSVQPVFTAINVLVFLLGLSNAVMLFLDPYRLYNRLPLLLSVILLNTPYPCMTSAFALVNWVLLSISQMRMTRGSRIRSAWFLALVILAHFVFIIAACLVLVYIAPVLVIGIICHGFFVVWGAVLCLTYIYSAWKIMSAEKHNRKTLYDISARDSSVLDSSGSVLTSIGSQSSKISQRLVSVLARSKKRPVDRGSDGSAKIFSIGENGYVQQVAVPVPPSIANGKPESVGDANKETTDPQIADAPERKLLPAGSDIDNSLPRQYSNRGMTGDGDSLTSPEKDWPQNGAAVNGKTDDLNAARQNPTPARADHETPTNRSINARAHSNGKISTASQSSKQRGKFDKQSGSRISGTGRPQKSTQKVFRISAITALLGITSSGLGLYGILGLMLASAADQPSEWGWYVFQTCFRFVELGMGCTMAYFTTQPFPRRRQR